MLEGKYSHHCTTFAPQVSFQAEESSCIEKKCVSSRTFIRFVSYMTGVLRGIKGRGPKKGREIGELDNTEIND